MAKINGIVRDKNGDPIVGVQCNIDVYYKNNRNVRVASGISSVVDGSWEIDLTGISHAEKIIVLYSFEGNYGGDIDIAGAEFLSAYTTTTSTSSTSTTTTTSTTTSTSMSTSTTTTSTSTSTSTSMSTSTTTTSTSTSTSTSSSTSTTTTSTSTSTSTSMSTSTTTTSTSTTTISTSTSTSTTTTSTSTSTSTSSSTSTTTTSTSTSTSTSTLTSTTTSSGIVCTWNPNDKHVDLTLSNGNLTIDDDGSDAQKAVRATVSFSSGKLYWEFTVNNMPANSLCAGWCDAGHPLTTHIGINSSGNGWGVHIFTGRLYHNTSNRIVEALVGGTGDIYMFVLDLTNGNLWVGKNGTWAESGDPANGTGYQWSGVSGTLYPAMSTYENTHQGTANFGASAFTYTVPSGFSATC